MPHITIEYTAELDGRFDVQAPVNAVHEAAITTAGFPLGGLRTLAATAKAAAEAQLAGAFADVPMGLQFELSEFDPALTLSRNTMIPAPVIRDCG